MLPTPLAQEIINLYTQSAPLGETPSLLEELKARRVPLEDTPSDQEFVPVWKRGFGRYRNSEDDDNEDGEDLDLSEQDVANDDEVLKHKQKRHVLSRASMMSSLATLKLLKQVWSNMEQNYQGHALSLDEEEQLAKMVEVLTSSTFVANPTFLKSLAEEFQQYKGSSVLPVALKNAENPFIKFDNDFLNGMLFGEIKTFLKKYPQSLPSFLSDAFDRNILLLEQVVSMLPQSNMETNIDWFVSNIEANPKQKEALKNFLLLSLNADDMPLEPLAFFEKFSSFKIDQFSDTLDLAFSLPIKTFQSVFKDETGLIHKKGLTGHGSGYRAEKPFSTVIKKTVLRDFKFYFTEKLDFLRSISTEYLENVDVSQTKLTKQDLTHIGQDVENLLAALQQNEKPNLKILITGKPGSGKTSLVHFALQQTKRLGITAHPQDMDSYTIQTLRDFAPVLGLPVIFLDGSEVLSGEDSVGAIKAKTPTVEIWTTNDPQSVKPQAMSSFDLVIDIPTFPFEKRKALAHRLFEDEKIADKVAKVCSTPGEIVKLSEWSRISGQKTWKELSVIANNIVQASIKSKTDALGKNLPITLHQPSDTNYGFDQVVGCTGIVEQARKMIAGYHHPQSFKLVNAKPPKGILLTGGPGLGKTYLVKAMAHEAGVPLLIASSSAMSSDPNLISSVFAEARRQAPCMLFLDEIDALGASGKKKDGSAAEPERQAILNRLLTEIDGFEGLSDVMVIGATHRSDVLDEALTRSGRLGWNINFSSPDFKSRLSLWQYYTKNAPLDEKIDFNRVTRLSVGMSPADINEAVNIAALNAAFNQSSCLTQQDLEKAIDQVEWGLNDDNKELLEQELERTAVHEAGHAVMSYLLDMPIERITVRPTHYALGFVQPMRDENKVHRTEEDSKKEIYVLFAGTIAEQVCLSSRSMGASSDLEKIRYITQTMFRDEGMGSLPEGVDFLSASPQTKRFVETEEQKFVKKYQEEAFKLVEQHKELIEQMAKRLVKDREMNSEEVKAFFEAHPSLVHTQSSKKKIGM